MMQDAGRRGERAANGGPQDSTIPRSAARRSGSPTSSSAVMAMPPLSRLVPLAVLPLAAAFGTINEPILLGQHNEHEMITRVAFQCPSGQKSDGYCFEPRSLDQLAGYHLNVMGLAIPGAGFNGAVGAPDTLDPVPEGPEAHCDDADYLDVPGYPQSRAQATANLQACIDHLRTRFRQAWASAERLLDEKTRIRPDMVGLSGPFAGDCTFAFPALQGNGSGRAKCHALEGLGRALHGVQDFYSHSNWADSANPNLPIGVSNPPGLAMAGTAPFLDLRATGPIPPEQIPLNLTTGCFALPDSSPGTGDCAGRVTHRALSKDNGVIRLDGSFGDVGPDSPRSEAVPANFRLAVQAAIRSSRDVWAALQDEIRHQYGAVRGNLIICALVRDDPVKDCRNRTVAMALDTSWGSGVNGAIQLERLVARELNSRLAAHGLDKVAVVEFDGSARLVYPMGYPKTAAFELSEPGGPRRIDRALELAIAETINAQPETYTDRAAILLLCTGSESPDAFDNAMAQVRRAEEGIRVHYGCINVSNPAGGGARRGGSECSPGHPLVPAALRTGGVVAFINSPTVKTPGDFINLVMDRGLTATDEDKDTARIHRLYPGLALANLLSPEAPRKSFSYPISAGENLNLTMQNIPLGGQEADLCFTVTLWNKGLDIKIATYASCSGEAPLSLVYEATAAVDLVLVAEYGGGTQGKDETTGRDEILFTIALDTTIPDKAETITRASTSILSTSTEVQPPGPTTEEMLTSKTVEVLASTAIVDGSTSITSSQWFEVGDEVDGGAFYPPPPEPWLFRGTVIETISATTLASNASAGPDGCGLP